MEKGSIEHVIQNSSNLTISTAKKTVLSLADYLHIKGLYLTAKLNPSENPLLKPQNIEFIIRFLNASTMLRTCSFWKNLNRTQKEALARYMTLRGRCPFPSKSRNVTIADEKNMQLVSKSSLKSADLYILLSGKAFLVLLLSSSSCDCNFISHYAVDCK